ncbi:hypothetical protein BDF14DRAFT_1801792 [Spinellus fusiger]|nr:hypothetical protein BDF14DRAFT_1801792 [Spinellus fusiger]
MSTDVGMEAVSQEAQPLPREPHGSIERKIQILLVEIEAMQSEENQLQSKYECLENSYHNLVYQLKEREETIRQLRHDLQVSKMTLS